MELQTGNSNKPVTTKDFLSLYKDSSSSPSTSFSRGGMARIPPPPPQGFLPKARELFHPPVRKATPNSSDGQLPPDINLPVESPEVPPAEHLLPGGIGTSGACHVPITCTGTTVKTEWGAETRVATATAGEEPTSTSSTSVVASGTFNVWEESISGEKGSRELAMRVEPKDNEQKPSTPRSKHSATEQRRRSKINDRFQILRDLIPHSDQKRDKASFLLEVIEYIQFLQEKVHKYESDFPAWNQDATNVMPWQRNPQLPVDSAPSEPANVDSTIPGKAPPFTASMQQTGIDSGFAQQQQRLLSEPENMVYPLPSQCLRSDLSGGQALDRDLAIDEGTISVSSAYSRQIMDALTQSLQKSGVDLSEASVSVQINLGRRSLNKSASVAAEHQGTWDNQATIGHSRSGSSEDESGRATKRQKQGTSR